MKQQLDRNLMQDALALSQAACYASMAAKEHREDSPQADAMLALTQKLTDMTIAALDAAVLPEIVAKPGEPTLADYVEQAKAASAAGQQVPDIVAEVPLPFTDADPAPADAETAIASQAVTLGDDAYKPLPVPQPAPVSLPSATELPTENLDVAAPVEVTPTLP